MVKYFFILLILIIAVRLWFYSFEAKTIYYPTRPWEGTPADFGMPYEDLTLRSADETKLNAWYLPKAGSDCTVLFLHGNAGNISNRLPDLAFFHKLNLSTMILEYRGYGKSEGKPSEKGLYQDARAAFDYLILRKNMDPHTIVLFGESLGGAVAIELASRVSVMALICEGSFSSLHDMGKTYFPYLPMRWLLTQKYDSLSKVAKIHGPKFFIHSRNDEIVPFALGKKLFDAATAPKEFIVRSGGHNDYITDPKAYETVFKKITGGSSAASLASSDY